MSVRNSNTTQLRGSLLWSKRTQQVSLFAFQCNCSNTSV